MSYTKKKRNSLPARVMRMVDEYGREQLQNELNEMAEQRILRFYMFSDVQLDTNALVDVQPVADDEQSIDVCEETPKDLQLVTNGKHEDDVHENITPDLQPLVDGVAKQKMQRELVNMASYIVNSVYDVEEDWQLSQFWYDNSTAHYLAKSAVKLVQPMGTLALIACPSLYLPIKSLAPTTNVKVLDVDRRFSGWDEDFIFYDYKETLKIDPAFKHTFDLVIIDPPFLSDECLLKCAVAGRYLAKDRIIVCTGTIMEESVRRFLKATITNFKPMHKSNLQNDFSCFINFPESEFYCE